MRLIGLVVAMWPHVRCQSMFSLPFFVLKSLKVTGVLRLFSFLPNSSRELLSPVHLTETPKRSPTYLDSHRHSRMGFYTNSLFVIFFYRMRVKSSTHRKRVTLCI